MKFNVRNAYTGLAGRRNLPMRKWLREAPKDTWIWSNFKDYEIQFINDEDALMFKLKFGL